MSAIKDILDKIDKLSPTAKKLYTEVIKATDKAAAKGIIHKNTAARKKSRFTLMLKKLAA